VLDVAHGELIMLGGYGAFFAVALLGLDPFVSLLVVIPLSLLLGVALIAAGSVALAEVAAAALGAAPLLVPAGRWLDALRGTRVGDRPAMVAFAVAAAAGLVLLAAQLRPGRERRARLDGAGPAAWWVARASAERYVRRSVLRGTGATGARVRLSPGARRWKLKVDADGPRTIRPEVEKLALAALDRIGAPERRVVTVKLHRARGTG
jgi:hypothetical protein